VKLDRLFENIPHKIVRECEREEISQITYDSRGACEGALFICLRGINFDGHNFIEKAVAAGASAVLIEKNFAGRIPQRVGIISVENTRVAMAHVAANFYGNPAKKMRIIGVTGTNGKTTTTYFIEEILRKCGRKTGLIGTVGISALGAPLEIKFATSTTPDPPELHKIFAQMFALGVRDVVMEVSSHALALSKLEGLFFDVGVFTNLTQDHLDFHGTMENYRDAKAKLFAQSKVAVVNSDDESSREMLKFFRGENFFSYAIENAANFRALHIFFDATNSKFELHCEKNFAGQTVRKPSFAPEAPQENAGIKAFSEERGMQKGGFRTVRSDFFLPVGGKFNVYNALAAIATAHSLGLSREEIRGAVAELSGVPGRIQAVPNARGLKIFVDYAHTPDGLKNIISAVRETTNGRVFTVFGCGGGRDKGKRPEMGKIAGKLSDFCVITSDNPRDENSFEIISQIEAGLKIFSSQYEIIENRRDAIFAAIKKLSPDDALIIAGKGHENYQHIGEKKFFFDDFETATEACAQPMPTAHAGNIVPSL